MFSIFKTNKLTSTESVDIIEQLVYEYLKPFGFRKHGRTLHRFVDGDISQVVHFQNGCPSKGVYDILWVNLGIRVPECVERKFIIEKPLKKYYHEYECNIRTRLGSLVDGKDTYYALKMDPDKIGKDIVRRLEKYVMPVFDVLNSRDAILKHRRDYVSFDQLNHHLIVLEEAMMAGRRGDIAEATRLYIDYYQQALVEYNHDFESGFVMLYNANKSHLNYLEKLAQELGIDIVF